MNSKGKGMNAQTSAFMDYKKVYDLFLGEVNDKFETKTPDIEMEERIMRKQNLDNAWYSVPFAVIAAGYYEVGDRHYTNRSSGCFFELIYTVAGHGIVEINGRTFDCVANTIILIDCSMPQSFHVKRGQTWEYKHIHFVVDGAAENVANHACLVPVYDNGGLHAYFDDILNELHHISANTCFFLSQNISAILTEMIRYQFQDSFTDPQTKLIKRAVEYIHEHYMEKITIKQLAGDEFISPYHFIRLFKKYYGVPPYNYLIDYRLKRAQYLFMQHKFIKEVAQECGFSSTNSFSRAFQKRFGVSPSEYRENAMIRQEDISLDFLNNKDSKDDASENEF